MPDSLRERSRDVVQLRGRVVLVPVAIEVREVVERVQLPLTVLRRGEQGERFAEQLASPLELPALQVDDTEVQRGQPPHVRRASSAPDRDRGGEVDLRLLPVAEDDVRAAEIRVAAHLAAAVA